VPSISLSGTYAMQSEQWKWSAVGTAGAAVGTAGAAVGSDCTAFVLLHIGKGCRSALCHKRWLAVACCSRYNPTMPVLCDAGHAHLKGVTRSPMLPKVMLLLLPSFH
jgi:hypothetical protein